MKILIILLTLSLYLSPFSLAQQKINTDQSKPTPQDWLQLKRNLKKRRSSLSSSLVSKKLERIQRLMGKKDSEVRVLQLITKLEKIVKNRPADLARVYLFKAKVYDSMNNFQQANEFYIKTIDMKQTSYNTHLSILFSMARLYLSHNKINEAADLIDQLFYLSDTITPATYVLKAYVLIERKQKKEALEALLKAVTGTSRPQESWLAFMASLQIEMGQHKEAIQTLTKLVARYPERKRYWKQLSHLYLHIKQEARSLAFMDLAYKLNFLEIESEIIHLASLLMYQGQPLKAARLVEHAITDNKIKKNQKNYEILGDCWQQAEEGKKALSAYQSSSQFAQNGKIFAKIGHIYSEQENWSQAVRNLQLAIKKKGIKKKEQLYILMGVSYFNLNKYEEAIKTFERIITKETKGRWIKIAREWINFISTQS